MGSTSRKTTIRRLKGVVGIHGGGCINAQVARIVMVHGNVGMRNTREVMVIGDWSRWLKSMVAENLIFPGGGSPIVPIGVWVGVGPCLVPSSINHECLPLSLGGISCQGFISFLSCSLRFTPLVMATGLEEVWHNLKLTTDEVQVIIADEEEDNVTSELISLCLLGRLYTDNPFNPRAMNLFSRMSESQTKDWGSDTLTLIYSPSNFSPLLIVISSQMKDPGLLMATSFS
ncbi:hypothetical protein Cgig2_004321 [Carnegiea gigantea]|uniref:Uncharacterized protein n=1 Tax=Carnegiea gigantea TaxID=171969 RepID=A0A9Q1GTX6_9CARY|nr:hypothetical protein Cgig2_004321 [Carnegiea gigantea]